MVRNTSHVLCGQLEIWYSYAFLFSVSVRLRLRPQLFFFLFFFSCIRPEKYGEEKRRKLEGIPGLYRWWNFVLGLFIRFFFANMCSFVCSLRLSASAALGLSHSATHKYEAYDRTDVIFFINHRRKTDSWDVAGPENTTQLSLATFLFFSMIRITIVFLRLVSFSNSNMKDSVGNLFTSTFVFPRHFSCSLRHFSSPRLLHCETNKTYDIVDVWNMVFFHFIRQQR